MGKIKARARFCSILLLWIVLCGRSGMAQNKLPAGSFELKNGDRVVFLGNSLFENDFQYGYLELALTTRFADCDVTFRNLGWSGDDVFGDARSTFTNPPTAYQHLIENITKAQPTVVFLGYGGIEAQEGEAGLPRFKQGLNRLLDKLDSLGAKTVLLSPIPVMTRDSLADPAKRNADLELYASVMAKTATDRNKPFIDIFKPIQELSKRDAITENGIHLNETGYYYLAGILEEGLGIKPGKELIMIHISKSAIETSAHAKMLGSGRGNTDLRFTIQEDCLPLPLPKQGRPAVENTRVIKITGLKKGLYTLFADDKQVITAAAKDWAEGIPLRQGPSFDQAEQVREMIMKKNDLHFFQYRPMNETYIIGFRSYEQGRHVKGLEEQNILITWLEGQIALKRMPKKHVYRILAAGTRP